MCIRSRSGLLLAFSCQPEAGFKLSTAFVTSCNTLALLQSLCRRRKKAVAAPLPSFGVHLFLLFHAVRCRLVVLMPPMFLSTADTIKSGLALKSKR